jgi:aldose 1-epimerase
MTDIVLTAEGQGEGPRFTTATFIPERGLMLSQLIAALPGREDFAVVADEPRAEEDFNGNASFSFGGVFLVPYANRIRGRPGPERTVDLEIGGQTVHLPANWSGKAEGSEPYAMHGLIMNRTVEVIERTHDRLRGRLQAGDFGGHWLSATELTFKIGLDPDCLTIDIAAENVGIEPLPMGIGWHPYLALPSGDRSQARLHVPAQGRLEVGDYDAVLPTGRVLPVAGSGHDVSGPDGRVLGDLYLDDCFVQLQPKDGVVARVVDPAGGVEYVLEAEAPVSAVQVYAPPDKAFVVVEPQFNWADPFAPFWPAGTDTGMVWVQPGERVHYRASLTIGKA